jgi:glucose-6-phosphate 1-dehydrogenase
MLDVTARKAKVTARPRHRPAAADPCAMVIFGAGGDLTKRLVVPALYNLERTGILPENFALVGVDLAQDTAEGWRHHLYEAMKGFVGNAAAEFGLDRIDDAAWGRLAEKMSYLQGDVNDPGVYHELGRHLEEVTEKHRTAGNVIFYLAVADRFFGPVVDRLGQGRLVDMPVQGNRPKFWRRVVIEKPFGHSFDSACALNARILSTLHEDQIFRIDHFVGKDTVQNIMAFRFANGIFEPIWNRDRIDHVQITAAEILGVEHRGKFYEATGALRDMVPNHLLSLLSLVAMEPPTAFNAASIHGKKAEVLAAMPTVKPDHAIRGQYGAGTVVGRTVKAYREEPNVAPRSNIETYVALRLEIDNWRWAGVPFYIRTGKHLSHRMTEVAICFKSAPYAPFRDTLVDRLSPNWLILNMAPGEGISLDFKARCPGPVMDLAAVRMDFNYDDWFPKEPSVGYETLLHDVMIGDQTRFLRADMVEHAWRIVQPVLDVWAAEKAAFPNYGSGSGGPQAADGLLAADGGRSWRPLVSPPQTERQTGGTVGRVGAS